jgi:predicted anti-sigma-YlaC factor YlaD
MAGNFGGGVGDRCCVKCEACREILSARLDGEDLPGEASAADAHLAGCVACAQWWEDAATVTRLMRLSAVTEPVAPHDPLQADRLRAAAPGHGSQRAAVVLRVSLGLLGLAQFLLGMAQISLVPEGHDHGGGVSPAHLWHESAAWNVAIGAGFGWIALRRTRPAALLPLLTAFVAMLVMLSVNDVWVGTVDGARLVSHGIVVAGYLVLVTLSRPRFDFGDPPSGRLPRPRWPVSSDNGAELAAPSTRPAVGLRLVTRSRPVPAARSDRAA